MSKTPIIKKFLPQDNLYQIELVYSDPHHLDNVFVTPNKKTAYISQADFIVSEQIEKILLATKQYIPHNMILRLYDCLRPIEAQSFMKSFKDSLGIDEHMLSNPGMGGHPRAMAIDCALVPINTDYGICPTDYGTSFDDLSFTTDNDGGKISVAHRNYTRTIPFMARQNRLMLEICLQKASLDARIPLMPLPQEWWDFRLPKNQNDYGHILASFNRIFLGRYEKSPEIKSYGEFHDYWQKNYDFHQIPNEKKHLIEKTPRVFTEQEFVFYEEYSPLSENDIHQQGFQITSLKE